jgi:(p)ppGpp synthase/HD superfamily hydrolase
MPQQLSENFRKALSYAFDLHADQIKKASGVPYVGHLLSVAGTVLEHSGTETQAIAALLHDAAEDQGGRKTLNKIERKFGREVADIVEDCTDTFETPKPPWLERKRSYLRHLPGFSDEVLLVVGADKLDNCRRTLTNLRLMGKDVWKTVSGGRLRLWYYRTIVEALRPRLTHLAPRLFYELEQAVSDLELAAGARKAKTKSSRNGKKP